MEFVRNAWKLLDGSYRLNTRFPTDAGGESGRRHVAEVKESIRRAGGWWDARSGEWIVPESAVDLLGVDRVFVVVTAGYCCQIPSRAEARPYQVIRNLVDSFPLPSE